MKDLKRSIKTESHGRMRNKYRTRFFMPNKSRVTPFTLIITFCFILSIGFSSFIGWKYYDLRRSEYLSGKNIIYKIGDVLGITAETARVTFDFSKVSATGSPLVFGGSHTPNHEPQAAWDVLRDTGFTMVRRDFYLDRVLPKNITISDYINNKNNVQDPKNWNQKELDITVQNFANAKKRGMKVIGIVAFTTNWMTYSGNYFGVPKDWNVYEDVVKKLYRIHRKNVDYLEIWNEPGMSVFLNLKNSPYTSVEAYKLIYIHAAKAIREVDAEFNDGFTVPLGGPVNFEPNDTKYLEAILQDEYTSNNLQFVSYHTYGYTEPSWNNFKRVLKKYGKENLPIYITEWNINPDRSKPSDLVTTHKAIPYTASKLVDFLNMGLSGANYFATVEINKEDPSYGYFGMYYVSNNQVILREQAKTWRLMSRTLGLGSGMSKVYEHTVSGTVKAMGFQNSTGNKGIVLVNENDYVKTVTVSAANITDPASIIVQAYGASSAYDGSNVIGNKYVGKRGNTLEFQTVIPPQTAIGLVFEPAGPLQRIFSNILP